MPAPQPSRRAGRFGRASRIKQSRDFARARQEGQRGTSGCLIANWRVLSADAASRLGVVVSGKVGGAVVRSRARRLLRETFRLHQHEFARPLDLVLVARQSIVGRGLGEVEKDFLAAMNRAGLLSAEGGVRSAE